MIEAHRRHFLSLIGAAALMPVLPLAAEPLAGAAIVADARLLKRVWTALHPGLLRYNSAADIDERDREELTRDERGFVAAADGVRLGQRVIVEALAGEDGFLGDRGQVHL